MPYCEQITCRTLHNSTGDVSVVKTALFIYATHKYMGYVSVKMPLI
jgi:hypothetical protein